MKTDRKILLAFLLNLIFSILELLGGFFTGSISILSDALHDFGDAISIGLSYFFEKKSLKAPDNTYTYGYRRFSVLGGFITSLILLFGSVAVVYNAVLRIINPIEIKHDDMIIFAILGIVVNVAAALFTHHGESINQKAVNLHMLEDALGWLVVFAGAIIIKFTGIEIIDPIMSIAVASFIFINAIKMLKEILDIFLLKIPRGISVEEIKRHVDNIDGVIDTHHIHIWSIDGQAIYATLHIQTDSDPFYIKHAVKEELAEHGIIHATIELESVKENCNQRTCAVQHNCNHHDCGCSHHHHHHHRI